MLFNIDQEGLDKIKSGTKEALVFSNVDISTWLRGNQGLILRSESTVERIYVLMKGIRTLPMREITGQDLEGLALTQDKDEFIQYMVDKYSGLSTVPLNLNSHITIVKISYQGVIEKDENGNTILIRNDNDKPNLKDGEKAKPTRRSRRGKSQNPKEEKTKGDPGGATEASGSPE